MSVCSSNLCETNVFKASIKRDNSPPDAVLLVIFGLTFVERNHEVDGINAIFFKFKLFLHETNFKLNIFQLQIF